MSTVPETLETDAAAVEPSDSGKPARPGRPGNRLRLAKLRDLALIPPIIVVLIIGYSINPDVFLTKAYLVDNVLKYQAVLALLVLAEALVLIVGKMDLSLESTVGFAPAIAVFFVVGSTDFLGAPWPAWTVLPVTLFFGVLVGLFNAFMIVKVRLSAFMVTLAMLILLRGLQLAIVGGATMSNLAKKIPVIDDLGSIRIVGLPVSIWIVIVSFGVGIVVLGYTRAGRSIYAVGGNAAAARAAGIRVERVVFTTLIIASVLAAFAGLMLAGQLGAVSATMGDGMIFKVFAAAVIGGIMLDGGKGSLFGALTGVLLLGLLESVLVLAQVDPLQIQAVYGLVILVALIIARVTSGKAQE